MMPIMLKNRTSVLLAGDIVMLVLSFLAMISIRFNISQQLPYILLQAELFIGIFVLWIIVLFAFNLYTIDRINPNPKNIGILLLALIVNGLFTTALFYFFPQHVSPKTNLVILTTIAFVLLVCWRRIYYNLFSKKFPTSIGIVGNSPLVELLQSELSLSPHIGIVRATWNSLPQSFQHPIDVLIVETAPPQALVETGRMLDVQTLSLVQAYEHLFGKVPLELMTDERALAIVTRGRSSRMLYRLAEIAIALCVLVVTSPLSILTSIAIFFEDGFPIFITQNRVGEHGKLIHVHKFRSMKALAPDGSAELNGAQWASKADPRITCVGRILRVTHIDEIPQMWDVIRGDLALVGPRAERPEIVAALEREIPYYYLRHTHKPGFTGWAQIKYRYARSVLDSREKFEYDLYYLLKRNLLLDFGILLKTVQIIFTH